MVQWSVVALCLFAFASPAQTARQRAECWSFSYRGEAACDVTGTLRVARRVALTAAQAKRWGAKARAFTIDLDSDGALDFIIEAPIDDERLETCFVGSTGVVHHCRPGVEAFDGFSLHWFAQLDDTPMLELFVMSGDEDSSDFSVQRLEPSTWKPTRVVVLAPFIVTPGDPRATFWGSPWDVRDVVIERKGQVRLASAEPSCVGAGLAPPTAVPVFFTGEPSQGEPADHWVRLATASRFRSLSEVAALAASKRPCPAVTR